MKRINCLIVDDEPVAQRILERFVNDVDVLELQGVCKDAIEASEILRSNKIDLLLLDINMPKLSGIAFYKSLPNPPSVIFTTAYPDYAVEGFEVNAIDYLLKPISFERFFAAVQKVKMLHSVVSADVLWVRADKTLYKLPCEKIYYLEALGDYVKIHSEDNKVIVTNETLKNLYEQLSRKKFVQVHKSYIVNLDKVSSVSGGQAFCKTNPIPIGRRYKEYFLKSWGK